MVPRASSDSLLADGQDKEFTREEITKVEIDVTLRRVDKLSKRLEHQPGLANATNPLGETALFAAAHFNELESAKILLKHGASWSHLAKWSLESPVHVAARSDALEVLTLLLDSGADINILGEGPKKSPSQVIPTPYEYASPLDAAAAAGAEKTVKLLLSRGAKMDVNPPETAYPAIHRAVTIYNQLGRYGDPKSLYDASALPPLDNHEVIELLLSHGATLNDRNARGYTPLQWGVSRGSYEIVEYLLTSHSKEIDVNALSTDGVSPLRIALQVGYSHKPGAPDPQIEMIQLLRKHGADVTLRCGYPGGKQQTAVEFAKSSKCSQAVIDALSP